MRSGPATLGFTMKRLTDDVQEWLGKRIGKDRFSGVIKRQTGSGLGECFHKGDAK